MLFTPENILLAGSILLFVSILAGKTGYRFGVPTLLLFLVVGMLFGSDGLGIQFYNMKAAQFIGMVALSIILFTGGMDTKFSDIRPVLAPGIMLSTVGVLFTTLFTGLFIWWLSGMSWTNIHFSLIPSLLLAATMSSTDSASVFSILRSQKINLKYNLRPMLELESGSNDPIEIQASLPAVFRCGDYHPVHPCFWCSFHIPVESHPGSSPSGESESVHETAAFLVSFMECESQVSVNGVGRIHPKYECRYRSLFRIRVFRKIRYFARDDYLGAFFLPLPFQ